MKSLLVWFDDEVHKRLVQAKGSQTWKEFISQLAEPPAKTWESVESEAVIKAHWDELLAAERRRKDERLDWHVRWRNASTDEERAALRKEATEKGWIIQTGWAEDAKTKP